MSKDDLGKYSNGPGAVARFVAQQLVMKPYVWSALSVHVHGMRRLDGLSAPFIAIANHSSHLDTTVIYGALPRRLSRNLAAGAAADYFFKQKTKSVGTRLFFNAYPVDRGGMKGHAGLSGRLLDEDVPLLIFPEGTRTPAGELLGPLQRGAANIAVRGHLDVTPVVIRCEPRTLGKGEKWYLVPARRFHLSVDVLPDLPVAPFLEDGITEPLAARRLTAALGDIFRGELLRAGAGKQHAGTGYQGPDRHHDGA